MPKQYKINSNFQAEKFDTSVDQIVKYDLKYATDQSNKDELTFLLTNNLGTQILHVGDYIVTDKVNNSFVINKKTFHKLCTPVK